jgi:hypothetical protein
LDLTIATVSNNGGNSIAMAHGLFGITAGIPVAAPYKHLEVKIDTTTLDRFTGSYAVAPSDTMQIVKKNGKLYRKNSRSEVQLKPESGNRFFYDDDSDRWIEFSLNGSGKQVSAALFNEGFKYPMKRL